MGRPLWMPVMGSTLSSLGDWGDFMAVIISAISVDSGGSVESPRLVANMSNALARPAVWFVIVGIFYGGACCTLAARAQI
jgi:hypothetical protein